MKYGDNVMKYVISHKDFKFPEVLDRSLYTVLVPEGVKASDCQFFKEELDNRLWSELSAMKYIADHVDNNGWTEINHYRRYFSDFTDLLPEKMCVPEPVLLNTSVAEQYSQCHNIDDLHVVTEIIQKKYPHLMNDWMSTLNGNILFPYNMVKFPNDIFKEYVNFMVSILQNFQEVTGTNTYEEMKEHVKSYDRPEYQVRLLSFLAERISTLFIRLMVLSKGMEVIPVGIVKFDNAW